MRLRSTCRCKLMMNDLYLHDSPPRALLHLNYAWSAIAVIISLHNCTKLISALHYIFYENHLHQSPFPLKNFFYSVNMINISTYMYIWLCSSVWCAWKHYWIWIYLNIILYTFNDMVVGLYIMIFCGLDYLLRQSISQIQCCAR